jgi:hypothetical protein
MNKEYVLEKIALKLELGTLEKILANRSKKALEISKELGYPMKMTEAMNLVGARTSHQLDRIADLAKNQKSSAINSLDQLLKNEASGGAGAFNKNLRNQLINKKRISDADITTNTAAIAQQDLKNALGMRTQKSEFANNVYNQLSKSFPQW